MLSATADDIRKIGQIIEMLSDCSTEEGVDTIFTKFGINDYGIRTIFLRQSMQVQDAFGVPNDKPLSDEDIYREELGFFLDGKWRDLI